MKSASDIFVFALLITLTVGNFQLAKMFIVVLIVFGLCWLPYHAYFFYTYYHVVTNQWCYCCIVHCTAPVCFEERIKIISSTSTLDGTPALSTSSLPSSGWRWPTPPSTPSSTSRWTPSGVCLTKLFRFITLSGFVIIWRRFQHPSFDTFPASTDHLRFSFFLQRRNSDKLRSTFENVKKKQFAGSRSSSYEINHHWSAPPPPPPR